MYGFEDTPLELAILEKKTGWALRSPRLVHPALASLSYSSSEPAARRKVLLTTIVTPHIAYESYAACMTRLGR